MEECDSHYPPSVMHNPKKRLREFGDAVDSHCYSLDDFRFHRRINGDWVPPLLQPQVINLHCKLFFLIADMINNFVTFNLIFIYFECDFR
jgi:hypothetical protein